MGNRRIALKAFFTAALLIPLSAAAATIERLETAHTDHRYTLSFEVVLDAERDKVWRIMTDYDNLPRLSRAIGESHILKTEHSPEHRVSVTFHACVLIFCKTMKKVVDIEARPQEDIVVTGVPALSDFSYSVEHWQVSAEGAQTRLRYHAEMVPDFFIPPIIGPWLVKSFLEREIRATAIKVEELARP
jgi:hypothetical protein